MKVFSNISEAQVYAAENGAALIVTDGDSVVLYETQDELPVQFKLSPVEEPIYYLNASSME